MTKTLLVTGAAGFIGSHFTDLAISKGYKVLALDALTYAGKRSNLPADDSDSFVFTHGDICDEKLIKTLLYRHKPVAIVQFAAESHVDRSIDNPTPFIQTNVAGTGNLLVCFTEYWNSSGKDPSFRFLQVSTDEVFGSLGNSGQFNEESPYRPNSPYAASKAAGDMLVRSWHQTYGLPTITTHSSNNYGPRQHEEKLIPHMIHCAQYGKVMPVYGDGLNIRDWLYVADHCDGILSALMLGTPGSSFCFGGRKELTNLEIVQKIAHKFEKPYLITHVKDRMGHDYRYSVNSNKANAYLGWFPIMPFEMGLETTLQWYIEQ